MTRRARILIVIACSLFTAAASADAPLPEPEPIQVRSDNGEFCADSIPDSDTIVRSCNSSAPLWTIPGWHRSIHVSNDGYVVIGFDGIDLLPLQYDPEMVMIEIWKDGKQTHQLVLTDIIKNRNKLRRTASHYYWGYVQGFSEKDQLVVTTVDRGEIRIDVVTAKRIR